MEPARARIVEDFPYPVAVPYALAFDAGQPASLRRSALCFTEYQMLRMVALPLVGQYLSEAIDESDSETIRKLNTAIASIRAPFFSDWIELVYALRKHLPRVGITPLFPGLDRALDTLATQVTKRPVDQKGVSRLDPLRAILTLRNATAHGGLPDEDEAARHLEALRPRAPRRPRRLRLPGRPSAEGPLRWPEAPASRSRLGPHPPRRLADGTGRGVADRRPRDGPARRVRDGAGRP